MEFQNYKIYVNIIESHGLMSYYFLNQEVPSCCQKLIKNGDTFLDVGSNMGHWAMAMASLVGSEGRVVAFEPNPMNRKMLERSVKASGFESRVEIISTALWSESGVQMNFHLSADPHNSGTSSLKKYDLLSNSSETIEVTTLAGDDFFKQAGIRSVSLMKVDVERSEYEVLCGMKEALLLGIIDRIHLETEIESPAWDFLLRCGYHCEGKVLFDEVLDWTEFPTKTFGDYLFKK